jgi:hypothetical protein
MVAAHFLPSPRLSSKYLLPLSWFRRTAYYLGVRTENELFEAAVKNAADFTKFAVKVLLGA